MKRFSIVLSIVAMFSVGLAGSAKATPTLVDSGSALQAVFDDITTLSPFPDGGGGFDSSIDVNTDMIDDSIDSYWSIGGGGGALSTIVIELAGLASSNSFGIYDASDPANSVEIFAGDAAPGSMALISILADGSVIVNFMDTTIDFASGNAFGFYLDSSATTDGGLWRSDTSLNSDGVDHMAAYQGVGDTIEIPPFSAGLYGPGEHIFAWEDLSFDAMPPADGDYADFVVLIESVNNIPEPTTLMVWGVLVSVGLCGYGWRRRKSA